MSKNLISRTRALAIAHIKDGEDSQGKKAGSGRKRYKIGRGSSYATTVIRRANPDIGMICRRCGEYILPAERCYSKQGNNDHCIRTYYHMNCVERLYQ